MVEKRFMVLRGGRGREMKKKKWGKIKEMGKKKATTAGNILLPLYRGF